MVTALVFLHSWMTNMRSFVVPKEISFTRPAKPSFSGVNSQNLGTILPPVAMAINCRGRKHKNALKTAQKLDSIKWNILYMNNLSKMQQICKTQRSFLMFLTSISGPPTQRIAGSSFCSSRWFASSSKPHWQMAKLAPLLFTWKTSRNQPQHNAVLNSLGKDRLGPSSTLMYQPAGSSPETSLFHISEVLCSPPQRWHPTYAWSWA